VTFTYNRLGQRKTVTDAVGTRTFGYNAQLQLDTEDLDGNGTYAAAVITRKYETSGTQLGKAGQRGHSTFPKSRMSPFPPPAGRRCRPPMTPG
jgi:hypothetical protein